MKTTSDVALSVRTIVDLPEALRQALRLWLQQQTPDHRCVFGLWGDRPEGSLALMVLLDTIILIDVWRGEPPALAWLTLFPRLPTDDAVARESVRLRQQHGLKVPDAISPSGNRAHNGDAPVPTTAA